MPPHLRPIDDLREATGLYARLNNLRDRLDTLPPEARPLVHAYEQGLRNLGYEPGATQWPAPPPSAPPLSAILRIA